jgi:hypothetical protein
MKRNLWLVVGYQDDGVRYDHKTRGIGYPLGVYSTEDRAREVGEAYAKGIDGDFFGQHSFSVHAVKLDVGASVRGLGDDAFQPALRTLGYPRGIKASK